MAIRIFIARLGVGEEVDCIEIFPDRDPAAIVVNDLGKGTVGESEELKRDADASQIVSKKLPGNLDDTTVPNRFFGCNGLRTDLGPGAIVEIGGFSMGKVTSVDAPGSARKRLQLLDTIQDGLLRWRELHGGGAGKPSP